MQGGVTRGRATAARTDTRGPPLITGEPHVMAGGGLGLTSRES